MKEKERTREIRNLALFSRHLLRECTNNIGSNAWADSGGIRPIS